MPFGEDTFVKQPTQELLDLATKSDLFCSPNTKKLLRLNPLSETSDGQ